MENSQIALSHQEKEDLVLFINQQINSADLDELTHKIFCKTLECLESETFDDLIISVRTIVAESLESLGFAKQDLIAKVKAKCTPPSLEQISVFMDRNKAEIATKLNRLKVIEAIFLGNWIHLDRWNNGDENYRNLFPELETLLKVACKNTGNRDLTIAINNLPFFLDEMEIEYNDVAEIVQLGNVSKTITDLTKTIEINGNQSVLWQWIINDLKLEVQIVGIKSFINIGTKIADLVANNESAAPEKASELRRIMSLILEQNERMIVEIQRLRSQLNLGVAEKNSGLIDGSETELPKDIIIFLMESLGLEGKVLDNALKDKNIVKEVSYLKEKIKINGVVKEIWQFLKNDLGLTASGFSDLLKCSGVVERVRALKQIIEAEGEKKEVWQFLKDDLKMSGSAIGLTLRPANPAKQIKGLKIRVVIGEETKEIWQFLRDELEFTSAIFGQFLMTGDVEEKVRDLNTEIKVAGETKPVWQFLKKDFGLTPSGGALLFRNKHISQKIADLQKTIFLNGEEIEIWRFLKSKAGWSDQKILKLMQKKNYQKIIEQMRDNPPACQ